MIRCFVAIDLPENVKDEIINIQNQLPAFKGKLTEKENLHMTLKFLAEIDEEKVEEAKKALKKIKFSKFRAKLGGIGVFSEDFVKIVWIKLENCDDLHNEVDNALSKLFKKEERFMSHLTIARVKYIKDKQKFLESLKNIKINPLEFEVTKISLKESTLTEKGHVYSDLIEIKLA